MAIALIADYTYAFKQTFSSKALFVAYLLVLSIRCILPFVIAIKNICRNVCNKNRNNLNEILYEMGDIKKEIESDKR